MSLYSWLIVALAFVAAPVQAAEETVFYCVVDQMLGIQGQRDSGNIKPSVERFTLKYTPAEYLSLPMNKSDPLYAVPSLETSFRSGGTGTLQYAYNELTSPFTSGQWMVGQLSTSNFKPGVDKKIRLMQLDDAISESKKGILTGAYVGTITKSYIHHIQIYKVGGTLKGVFFDSILNDPALSGSSYEGFLAYVSEFSCQAF